MGKQNDMYYQNRMKCECQNAWHLINAALSGGDKTAEWRGRLRGCAHGELSALGGAACIEGYVALRSGIRVSFHSVSTTWLGEKRIMFFTL